MIKFFDIEHAVPSKPGIYEIHTREGVPLKVGIAGNLRKRLLMHRASLQRYLRPRAGGDIDAPTGLVSKRSILAKHLYYDASLTKDFDLKSEEGRRGFLEKHCYIRFQITESRQVARELEKRMEREGGFRFTGKVVVR